jgi:SpoVK/Ycf46/Vps4 family AAA+-type ATPase
VFLLDEFDALAKRRDDDTDIGELKRIVNVVLIELDRWPDTSLLVAATNHPQLLDPAVDRRFDRSLSLRLPGHEERRAIFAHLMAGADLDDDDGSLVDLVATITTGQSGSDLARLSDQVRRRAVLGNRPISETLTEALWAMAPVSGPARDQLWLVMADQLHLSNRQIAAQAGVSHPTVAAALKRARSQP